MSFVGGTQLGDRFDNLHDYYQEMQNKGGVAYTKGQVLSTDQTTGNVILAPTTNARRPFFVAYADSVIADPRQPCWKQEGMWLVGITTTALKPNSRLKPSTTVAGQLEKLVEGTDTEALCVGVYKGTLDLGVDITSGTVRVDDAEAGELIVYEFKVY